MAFPNRRERCMPEVVTSSFVELRAVVAVVRLTRLIIESITSFVQLNLIPRYTTHMPLVPYLAQVPHGSHTF